MDKSQNNNHFQFIKITQLNFWNLIYIKVYKTSSIFYLNLLYISLQHDKFDI